MSTFRINNYNGALLKSDKINHLLRQGGPDGSSVINKDSFTFRSHLFDLDGNGAADMAEVDGLVYCLSGSLYNKPANTTNIEYISQKYASHGNTFVTELDGDYSIAIYDSNAGLINIFIDQFGTKPTFYNISNTNFDFFNVGILKYKTKDLNISSPENFVYPLLENNSHYTLNVNTFELTQVNNNLQPFNLDQTTDNLTAVTAAMEQAILKRWHPNCSVFLGDGINSVIIAIVLAKYQKSFNAITFSDGTPINSTLQQTRELCGTYMNHIMIDELTPAGVIYQCGLREKARLLNSKVTLKGSGTEFLDLVIPSKQLGTQGLATLDMEDKPFTEWPSDLSTVYPWPGFKTTNNVLYHHKFSMMYGQDMRNTYYDREFIQAWLNTTADLKNSRDKFVQKAYLEANNIDIPTSPGSLYDI